MIAIGRCLTPQDMIDGYNDGSLIWMVMRQGPGTRPQALHVLKKTRVLGLFPREKRVARVQRSDPEWKVLKPHIDECAKRLDERAEQRERRKRGLCPTPPSTEDEEAA